MEAQMKVALIGAALLVALDAPPPRWPHQGTSTTIDCDAGGRIGPALSTLRPGDTLLVKGTCRENVSITAERHRLTLDGRGVATISAPDAGPAAVAVTGREIVSAGRTQRDQRSPRRDGGHRQ